MQLETAVAPVIAFVPLLAGQSLQRCALGVFGPVADLYVWTAHATQVDDSAAMLP